MQIPMVDLRVQYEALRPEIDDAIRDVLERSDFVLGRVVERFEQAAQIEQLESFYEEAITMNGATEAVKARPIARFAPQFAEGLPAE